MRRGLHTVASIDFPLLNPDALDSSRGEAFVPAFGLASGTVAVHPFELFIPHCYSYGFTPSQSLIRIRYGTLYLIYIQTFISPPAQATLSTFTSLNDPPSSLKLLRNIKFGFVWCHRAAYFFLRCLIRPRGPDMAFLSSNESATPSTQKAKWCGGSYYSIYLCSKKTPSSLGSI